MAFKFNYVVVTVHFYFCGGCVVELGFANGIILLQRTILHNALLPK